MNVDHTLCAICFERGSYVQSVLNCLAVSPSRRLRRMHRKSESMPNLLTEYFFGNYCNTNRVLFFRGSKFSV